MTMKGIPHMAVCAALGLGLAGCASGPTASEATAERHCFNADRVSNYAVVDSETVNLRVGSNEYYQIKLLGVCPDINWSQKVGLSTDGSATVCTGVDLTLLVPSSTGPQECAAESLRKLSASEIAALSGRAKP